MSCVMQNADYLLTAWNARAQFLRPLRGLVVALYPLSPGLRPGRLSVARCAGLPLKEEPNR